MLTASAVAVLPMGAAWSADEADVNAIQEIWITYASTRVAADAETWLSLWDEGAVKMSQGKPVQTLDDMKAGAPKKFVPGSLSGMEINPEEIVVMGDWAFSRGNYNVNWEQDGKNMAVDGLFMTILKRQEDGSWKIFRDMAYLNK